MADKALPQSKFIAACERACALLRELAPYDTGNLARNAIKIEFPSPDTCIISVDTSIAPYMPYTTLPWMSERWNGKKNPNEGWWESAFMLVLEEIANALQGVIT